jgi:hypothetical protein
VQLNYVPQLDQHDQLLASSLCHLPSLLCSVPLPSKSRVPIPLLTTWPCATSVLFNLEPANFDRYSALAMDSSSPSQEPSAITIDGSNNVTPVLQIVTFVLVVFVFLVVVTRIATRFSMIKKLSSDDYLIMPALVIPTLNALEYRG